MHTVPLKDTHILLDTATRQQLSEIARWSNEPSGVGKTVRALTRRYYSLLSRQVAAEKAGHTCYIIEVEAATGLELARERIDLKI